jgi:hypothetical protein
MFENLFPGLESSNRGADFASPADAPLCIDENAEDVYYPYYTILKERAETHTREVYFFLISGRLGLHVVRGSEIVIAHT